METWKPKMLLGRLANGCQSDHGIRVHAVVIKKVRARPCPYNDWGKDQAKMTEGQMAEVGLCGARPGRRSVGWSPSEGEVNCPKCLKKLEKL